MLPSWFSVFYTVFREYFVGLLRISMGDNKGYVSCLFCPVTGISKMKTRNISTVQ